MNDLRIGAASIDVTRRTALKQAVGGLAAASLLPGVQAQPRQPLKIGMVRPMTGRFATAFAPLYAPARLAAEEINAAGGILGRPIEFVEEDDEGSPAKQPAVIRKLQESGISIVIGPVGTSQAMSALTVSGPARMIHCAGAFAVEVVDGKQYPFHYQFNYHTGHQSAAVVDLAVKRMPQQKIGILHELTGWGESFGAQVVARMKDLGAAPVGVETYALTAPDVRNQLRNLQRAGTTMLIAGSSVVPGTVLVLNSLKGVAWLPTIAGGNGFFSDSLLDILPAEGTDRMYATYLKSFTYFGNQMPGSRQAAYAKKLAAYPEVKGQEPNAIVSPFYDFLHALKAVAEKEKSVDTAALKKGFDSLSAYPGMQGTLNLSADSHAALPDDSVTMVKVASARDPRSATFFRERAFD